MAHDKNDAVDRFKTEPVTTVPNPPATNPQPETHRAESERGRLPNAPSVAEPDTLTAGNIDNHVDLMTPPRDRFAAAPQPAPSAVLGRVTSPIVHPAAGGRH